MAAQEGDSLDLDGLAARAASGDAAAEGALFAALRERLEPVAKRRVREEEREDCVQEALRIVLRKYRSRPRGVGILPWSYAVLRRVVGNTYLRRERARSRTDATGDVDAVPDEELDPLAGREARQLRERIARAIRRIETEHARCATSLRALLAGWTRGDGADDVAREVLQMLQRQDASITRSNFHVILHRCRNRLRLALDALDAAGGMR